MWGGKEKVMKKPDEVKAILAELHKRAAAAVDPNSPFDMEALRKAWDRNPPCPDCGSFDHFECFKDALE